VIKKIAYVGIDLLFPVLRALADEECEIIEIFSCPTDNVTEFNTEITSYALTKGIPLTMERITPSDLARLKEKGCQLLVCGGYYYRIPATDAFPMVNFHPSMLPEGRGSWPMATALLKGLKSSGITVHKIARGFDEGDILLQRSFPLDDNDTHKDYMDKVYANVPEMVSCLLSDFDEIWENARPQGQGEYWECPTEKDYTIRFDMSVEAADRVLRAFCGYECVYVGPDGKSREIVNGRAFKGDAPETVETLPLNDGYVKIEEKVYL
jgi:methionyl-tRNA formyltransferase